jgi:hypothetical protein
MSGETQFAAKLIPFEQTNTGVRIPDIDREEHGLRK